MKLDRGDTYRAVARLLEHNIIIFQRGGKMGTDFYILSYLGEAYYQCLRILDHALELERYTKTMTGRRHPKDIYQLKLEELLPHEINKLSLGRAIDLLDEHDIDVKTIQKHIQKAVTDETTLLENGEKTNEEE